MAIEVYGRPQRETRSVPIPRMKSYLTWHGTADPAWLAFLGGTALAAALLVALLYRYERRLVSRRLGWSLMGLRLSVVALLFLTLLEPVRITEIDRERTGRILLAVDLSESMDTVDAQAEPGEKLRWARALGMYGNEEIADRLDRWQQAFDEGREPEWVEPREGAPPGQQEQLAADRRAFLESVFAQLTKLSRREITARLLTQPDAAAGGASLIERLGRLGLLEASVFAGESDPVPVEGLARSLQRPDADVLATETDLAVGLATQSSAGSEAPAAGIVLFTDGRHNAEQGTSRLADVAKSAGVPIYPVLVGSEIRPKDIAFERVDYPRQPVAQDGHPVVRARLRTSGFEGEEVTVSIEPVDGAPGEPQTRTVPVAGPVTEIQFALDAAEVGRHRYVVRTPVREGETREDNNERSFSLTVVDDEADVLLVEGEARWEFRFLDNALKRDEQVRVQELLFRQPFMGVLPEPFFPRRLDLPGDPQNVADSPFSEFDVVILGDVGQHQLPAGAWPLLDRFVREEGGTLVILSGKRHMPLGYANEGILEALLPVTDLREVNLRGKAEEAAPLQRGFHLNLTAEGRDETFLQLSADPLDNDRVWSELPGHTWGLVGEAKGEATVLAATLPEGVKPTLQTERQHAIIAQQPAGFGQVLWIGIDSTWRWRHRVGDEHHHRFWGQLARWGARFKALSRNEHVAFGPVEPSIESGDEAVLRASWNRDFLKRFPSLQATAVLSRMDDPQQQPVMSVPLSPSAVGPFDFEGRVTGLRPGDYRVALVVDQADPSLPEVTAELHVQEPLTSELGDISANRELLATLAEESGGRLFLPHELSQLPDLFRSVSETTSLRTEQSLWDSWPVLLAFFALLTAEWVLRKLNGLP